MPRRPGRRVLQEGDGVLPARGDVPHLGDHLGTRDHPEVHVPAVRDHGDVQACPLDQRTERVHGDDLGARRVEGDRRSRHVGDDPVLHRTVAVGQPAAGVEPHGLVEDRRRRELGDVREHVRPDGVLHLLGHLRVLADLEELVHGVVEVHGKVHGHARHLVGALGPARAVGGDRTHHHQRLIREIVVRGQVGPQRPGARRQDDVVDLGVVGVLDGLQVVEVGLTERHGAVR